jgi:hypothetical protein
MQTAIRFRLFIATIIFLVTIVVATPAIVQEDGFPVRFSSELRDLLSMIEKVYYTDRGLSPSAEVASNPLRLAVFLGHSMAIQYRSVDRYKDLQQRFDLLVMETKMYLSDVVEAVNYPMLNNVRIDEDLMLQYFTEALEGAHDQWLSNNYGETAEQVPLVLESGPDVAGYDTRGIPGVEDEETIELIKLLKK